MKVCYPRFFFQAEDGIRDGHVTGVQTCALPIYNGISYSFILLYKLTRDIPSNFAAALLLPYVLSSVSIILSFSIAARSSCKIGRASCRERVSISVVNGTYIKI